MIHVSDTGNLSGTSNTAWKSMNFLGHKFESTVIISNQGLQGKENMHFSFEDYLDKSLRRLYEIVELKRK